MLRLTGNDTQFTAFKTKRRSSSIHGHMPFKIYTLNSDFDLGSLINVAHSTPDQLELDSTIRSFNLSGSPSPRRVLSSRSTPRPDNHR